MPVSPTNPNSLEIRLAETAEEVAAAQALRYRIFFEELGAVPSEESRARGLDIDPFDPYCDHLIVLDRDRGTGESTVVGTYRLLRRSRAKEAGTGFYTAQEYNLGPLMAHRGEVMELGRSCVDPAYRSRAIMQMLWGGIAEYITVNRVDVMFGCGSFHGTEVAEITQALSYLYHFHLAPRAIRPYAHAHHRIDMDLIPADRLNTVEARQALPPLIKGYLRLGGFVGDGAYIDHSFNTIDVCIVVQTAQLTEKYSKHFNPSTSWTSQTPASPRPASDRPLASYSSSR